MSPKDSIPDFEDISKLMGEISYSLGISQKESLQIPKGARVIYPDMTTLDGVIREVKNAKREARRSRSDIIGGDYEDLYKIIHTRAKKEIVTIADTYNVQGCEIESSNHEHILYHKSSDTKDIILFNPILNYRPMILEFDPRKSTDIMAYDLEASKEYRDIVLPHLEMDGFTSVQSQFKKRSSIPNVINIHDRFRNWSNELPDYPDIIVSRPIKEIPNEQLWLYPFWDIRIISVKDFRRDTYTQYRVMLENRTEEIWRDAWQHRVEFEASGALFYDAFTGKYLYSILNSVYFDRNDKSNMDFEYGLECISRDKLKTVYPKGQPEDKQQPDELNSHEQAIKPKSIFGMAFVALLLMIAIAGWNLVIDREPVPPPRPKSATYIPIKLSIPEIIRSRGLLSLLRSHGYTVRIPEISAYEDRLRFLKDSIVELEILESSQKTGFGIYSMDPSYKFKTAPMRGVGATNLTNLLKQGKYGFYTENPSYYSDRRIIPGPKNRFLILKTDKPNEYIIAGETQGTTDYKDVVVKLDYFPTLGDWIENIKKKIEE